MLIKLLKNVMSLQPLKRIKSNTVKKKGLQHINIYYCQVTI